MRFENGATRTPEVKYTYGGGKRIALEKDGGIYYYHPDRLGSVRLITDEDGRVLKRCNYTAFGSVLSDSGTFDNDYLYTSQVIDENDLYYMHARYYDNSIGRFTNTDPFPGYRSIPSTMHPYNYCGGNPVNFIDPLGLNPAPEASLGLIGSCDDPWQDDFDYGYNDEVQTSEESEGPKPSNILSGWGGTLYDPGSGEDPGKLFITGEAEEKFKKTPMEKDRERNLLIQSRYPLPSNPKIIGTKAYGARGGSPFESYNPRGASVNDDFTSLVSSILGAGLHITGVPPLIVGGFFLQGIGAYASVRSTYSTWQNRGLSIPGYCPITSFDVRVSIAATSVQIGTIF